MTYPRQSRCPLQGQTWRTSLRSVAPEQRFKSQNEKTCSIWHLNLHPPAPSCALHQWTLPPKRAPAQTSCPSPRRAPKDLYLSLNQNEVQNSCLVDDLCGLLDELCASHLRHLDLLQLRLGGGLGLASSAAPVAWSLICMYFYFPSWFLTIAGARWFHAVQLGSRLLGPAPQHRRRSERSEERNISTVKDSFFSKFTLYLIEE